jgi:SH3-like domain-containing protein
LGLDPGRAMMRTGPAQTFPGTWLYTRADLPIQVIEIYQNWRKIRDPDGTTGWMMVNLLSDQRTAIVQGTEPRPMHEAPDETTPIRYRVAPGVVGRVSRCAEGWCRFDVHGRNGYIRIDYVWGVGQNETIR